MILESRMAVNEQAVHGTSSAPPDNVDTSVSVIDDQNAATNGADRVARILVVEDDMSIVRLIRASMRLLGSAYIFSSAKSAEEGLALWETTSFDILLSDYNLPGMSGIEMIRLLKARNVNVPIIMFTAYHSPELAREARKIGVDRYLAKPFLIEELISSIRRLLGLQSD